MVNFDYLIRIMETYGFIIAPKDDLVKMDINKGIGTFAELFKVLQQKLKSKVENQNYYGTAENMSPEEKKISFLNKYFIFKKIRNVDANEIYNIFINVGDNLYLDRSMTQFYTLPNNTVTNDRKDFQEWLYGNMPSCKDQDPLTCLKKTFRHIPGR